MTPEQAHSELNVIAGRIEQQFNDSHAGTTARVVPLQEEIVGTVRPILLVLLAAVAICAADRVRERCQSSPDAIVGPAKEVGFGPLWARAVGESFANCSPKRSCFRWLVASSVC